jgi:hypothetical protein
MKMKGRVSPNNEVQRDFYGTGSAIVWTAIYQDWKKDFVIVRVNVTSQKYCDEIIKPVVVPFVQQHNIKQYDMPNRILHDSHKTIYNVNVRQWP